jgi:hypothetical protein
MENRIPHEINEVKEKKACNISESLVENALPHACARNNNNIASFRSERALRALSSLQEALKGQASPDHGVPNSSVVRKLNRGTSTVVRKLVRGEDTNPPIVRRLVRGNDTDPLTIKELSTVEKLLLMQDKSYVIPPTKITTIPKHVLEIIEYWNKHSGATKHKLPKPGEEPTVAMKLSHKLIKNLLGGKVFIKQNNMPFTDIVTKSDIEEAIDLFHSVVTDPDILPVKKDFVRSMGFYQFIYHEYTGMSYFVKCFRKEILNNGVLQFKDAVLKEVFEALKNSYDKFFLRERDFTLSELRKIRTGADLLIEKMDELAKTRTIHNIDLHRSIDDDDLWADWVMESLIDNFGRNISVGSIASRYTYDVCLIRYLEKKGRLDTEENNNIFDSFLDENQEIGSFFPPEYANRTIQMEEY